MQKRTPSPENRFAGRRSGRTQAGPGLQGLGESGGLAGSLVGDLGPRAPLLAPGGAAVRGEEFRLAERGQRGARRQAPRIVLMSAATATAWLGSEPPHSRARCPGDLQLLCGAVWSCEPAPPASQPAPTGCRHTKVQGLVWPAVTMVSPPGTSRAGGRTLLSLLPWGRPGEKPGFLQPHGMRGRAEIRSGSLFPGQTPFVGTRSWLQLLNFLLGRLG